MICISKKILCYILIGILTFSVTSTVYYKSVHAMEWVGGALAFEEALKWLLAAIGITATAGMTDAYWDTYGDDFVDYAVENGATQTEVAEWQLKACQGIIDKGSLVWQKFKAWANSLVSGSTVVFPVSGCSYSEAVDYINSLNILGVNLPLNNNYLSRNVYAIVIKIDNARSCFFYTQNINYVINNLSTGIYESYLWYYYLPGSSTNGWTNGSSRVTFTDTDATFYISDNIVNNTDRVFNIIPFSDSGSVADSNFEASATNVNDLDVISSDGVDEDNPEVTIPMPGVSDSDNEASKDAYQDIIDAINDGTITQEQGVEQIQEILKIVTYDTVTDKVVPPQQNEDGTDKTKDDALKENKENMGFTLGGLEAVFPFCIPFDIYAFMTLLVADPVAPEFDFPIQSVNGQVEEIHVDLEPFEPVAVVVRYCFDFLFIIGLALATRELIGAGGGD